MGLRSVKMIGGLAVALLSAGCAVTGKFGNYHAGEPAVFVVEQNDERNSVRLLDLPIFSLFEYTRDKTAGTVQVGFLESPIFKIFSRREEDRRGELRFMDLRLLALFRKTHDGNVQKMHVLKIPFLGSLYGFETDGETQRRNILFVSREGPVPPPEPETPPEPEEPPTPTISQPEEPPTSTTSQPEEPPTPTTSQPEEPPTPTTSQPEEKPTSTTSQPEEKPAPTTSQPGASPEPDSEPTPRSGTSGTGQPPNDAGGSDI